MSSSKAKAAKGKAAANGLPPGGVMGFDDVPQGLPPAVELARTRVICGPDFNSHVRDAKRAVAAGSDVRCFQTEDYMNANSFMACNVDNAFSLDDFQRGFRIEVTSLGTRKNVVALARLTLSTDKDALTFEMKGVGPAVANAFRRILLSEVPTVAIEHVFVVNNTSVIQDEVLAHRLGLVPLGVDPHSFEFRAEGDAASERNTVVFRLKLKCAKGAGGELINGRVTSGDLVWLADGSALPEDAQDKLTRRESASARTCLQRASVTSSHAPTRPTAAFPAASPGCCPAARGRCSPTFCWPRCGPGRRLSWRRTR